MLKFFKLLLLVWRECASNCIYIVIYILIIIIIIVCIHLRVVRNSFACRLPVVCLMHVVITIVITNR